MASGPANMRGAPTETRKSLSAPSCGPARTQTPLSVFITSCARNPSRSRRRVATVAWLTRTALAMPLRVMMAPKRFIKQ